YVCGITTSADFPVTANAVQRTYGGGGFRANNGGGAAGDAFIAKLNANGSALEFATYLGGDGDETANGIAVDAQGNVFVTGTTGSTNFPATANAFQKHLAHPVSNNDPANNANTDAYVAKLNPDGSALVYATYLGGSGQETVSYSGGNQLAIDGTGAAYVVGATVSQDFPVANALQSVFRNTSGFLTKVNPDGSGVIFSTLIGCQAFVPRVSGIALDANGDIFLTGEIHSSFGFPLVNALQPPTDNSAFLTKISADASRMLYSTTLGGGGGLGVAVDRSGNAYVAGFTPSSTFPVTANAFQPNNHGDWDAFMAVIHSESELPPPAPTISCPADSVVNAAAGQCSAIVNFSVSASSPNSRCVEVTSTPPSGSAFPVGSTIVTCQAKDAVGGSATCSFTVTVNDTQRPVIVCPADLTVNAPCGQSSAIVHYPTPSATDTCSDVSVSCTPASGEEFPVGVTRVNCVARDAAGNTASCRFNITVNALTFDFNGFLPPIGGADATGGSFDDPLQTFKLKSTIPVKFKATCNASPVLAGIHTLQAIKYSNQTTSDTPIDATPTEAATTGNQFRLTGDEWHFNLDTKGTGMSAGIWNLRATLSDGSQHSVWIQIK
ncbi:MAG TPA: HYR domain-containing protein, partial [Verrucomicrobiae bacterium]|nr:HYR domain-containing protein [Verrucomicrobiae bacterium]